jgi:hypothetical protein
MFAMPDPMILPPLGKFATIDDFVVRLVDDADGGKHIELASAAKGRLAGFPAWDHADRDLRHFAATDVPFGSVDEPYDDRDDGWRIAIFADSGWVYIAEGDDASASEPASAFRVSLDRYFKAWAALIDQHNPITPLDDAD